MKRSTRVLAVTAAVAILAAGCSAPPPIPTPSPTATVNDASETEPVIAPLTGLEVVDDLPPHPVFMAKIDNHPDARPQYGLNQTDIVFEELVEGGMTRYVAIWHSTMPEQIGPVRSIRPMDPDIASPFKGIIAYSGGQTPFVNMMRATQVVNFIHGINEGDAYMSRTDEKPAPHNVVVRARQAVIDRSDLEAPGVAFLYAAAGAMPTAVQFGQSVSTLTTKFSKESIPSWVWDAESGLYQRKQSGGEWDVDEAGNVITAVNIIVQITPETTLFGNVKFVPKAETVGTGVGYVSTGGKTFQMVWSKTDRNAFTTYSFQDENPVRLAPGNTWIELVPTKGTFSTEPALR
jgi:hypothetical protein